MLLSILLFAVGLVLLIKGGDWFVDGATGIARRFHLPDIVVGATVVSIGTTLPEVMVSATGAMLGQGAMAYGNAIGSIICNTALIAAISVAVNPGPVNTKSMKMPVLFFFVSAAIYCVAAYLMGEFTRPLGVIMLTIFVVYLIFTVRQGMKNPEEVEEEEEANAKPRTFLQDLFWLVVGAGLIAVGADLLVEHGTIIAVGLGVPETVIALTFVALGTSLPELVTTITSLRKGHASLGIGNVIGANVFNLVLVSGVAVTLAPFEVPVGNLIFGHNASLVMDIPIMLTVMLLLTMPALATKKLHRWQGVVLLCIYAAFCICQFAM
ncbi:MAG TPA: calcium/sodium antiporter [Candidatus Faecousia intestinavium]|nr:calcium/sodium antiporter [Candidatus Faecousia intestinavium]